MRKIILLSISFLLFIVCFTSCKSNDNVENPERAFDYVKSITNYISDIRITFKNDRNEEIIFLKQYISSDNKYRLDLEGERSYIYKDDKIYVKDIKNNREYFLEENFDEVYKYSFLNEYIKLIYSMDEVSYFTESYVDGDEHKTYFAARVNLPTNNLNINYAVLYLNENYTPLKLEIFDSKDKLRVLVEYITFDVVGEIDKSLFDYEK